MKLDIPYEHLRALREDRGLSQKEIAAVLNIAQNTYSQYETGAIALTAPALIALADFYGVNIDYILDRTDMPGQYPPKTGRS